MSTTVVNVKKAELGKRGIGSFSEWLQQPNTVYIGRNMSFYVPGATKSIWANPYTVKQWGRDECLQKYEQYVRLHLMDRLEELRGKELGCWCAPEACHGNVLVRLLNEE